MTRIHRMAPASCRRHRVSRPRARLITAARRGAVAAAAMAATLTAPVPLAAQERPLDLESYRFWREPDLTLTEVFAVIPLQGLTFQAVAGVQRASYQGTLEIRDSTGLVLRTEEWTGAVSLPRLTPETLARSTTAEHFTFSLKPGLYRATLEIADSATGRVARTETEIRAPALRPAHSDLLMASDMSRLEEDAEPPQGSLRRGTLALVPNFGASVSPEKAAIGLFMEVYRSSTAPETASVNVVIDGRQRSFHHETGAQTRIYPPGGGVEAFGLDVAGLPPGEYDLQLVVAFPSDTLRGRHMLVMLPPGAGEMRVAGELPYPGLSSAEMDSIWGPMTHLATQDETELFLSLSSADAKRRFIQQFWERRAAATHAEPTALREEFEARVEFANRQFRPPRPGQRNILGWQTDRGRIWIMFGPPAERHQERERKDQTNPWEVWRYIEGRGDKYVFWDRSGFGDYILVYTTSRDFLGVPGWERYFTGEALDFIRRF